MSDRFQHQEQPSLLFLSGDFRLNQVPHQQHGYGDRKSSEQPDQEEDPD